MTYDLVAENPESTVVAEYQTEYKRATNYQSEADLEQAFIAQLQTQGYEYHVKNHNVMPEQQNIE